MHCNHCQLAMELIKEEANARSLVQWHRCPNCKRVHLLSEPRLQDLDNPLGISTQPLEFRSARLRTESSAYSGPERRIPKRGRTSAF